MDQELDEIRRVVDCRAVLEKAGWALDKAQSSVNAAKYRDGPARIVIVTHQGKGWFDPLSEARGNVIALAQHLYGGSLGHARQLLRPLAGIPPSMQPGLRTRPSKQPLQASRDWSDAHPLVPGGRGWDYLAGERRLPSATIERAARADQLREGPYGTVWAVHRAATGEPCGWEMRGPAYKGFCKGGHKALFRIGDASQARRLTVSESAIDALSLATLEGWPEGTAYFSTGGGFGPRTVEVIQALVPALARLVAATDNDEGGELLAERLRELARKHGAAFGRLRPSAKDWNAQLKGE